MNKKILFVVIGIVLLIAVSLWYLATRNSNTPPEASTTTSREEPKPQTETPVASTPGAYVAYSKEKVEQTAGTKLLFFHAPWCPQCQSIEKSINEEGIPDNVTVFKVDYDSNQALRQKYGVTLQTTFVKIDDAGNKIESYTAYEEPHFSAVERALLK
jgi:thiol-disulfide isomerase/thioredoxin